MSEKVSPLLTSQSSELNPKVSVKIQKILKKWKKKFVYTTNLASVNTERNVRKKHVSDEFEDIDCKTPKNVTKGTRKGAENIIWENVYLKVNVPTNTYIQLKIKIMKS